MKELSYNKKDECNEDVLAVKKENHYMFLITPKFKFFDVNSYIGPGLSYDVWCKSMGFRLEKLMFPYKWLDSYKKLSHAGPVPYEDFYSSLKSTITRDECEQFLNLFKENDCTTVGNWLWVYNVEDFCPLLRSLGRWLSNTIMIKLIYAKMQLVFQVYH